MDIRVYHHYYFQHLQHWRWDRWVSFWISASCQVQTVRFVEVVPFEYSRFWYIPKDLSFKFPFFFGYGCSMIKLNHIQLHVWNVYLHFSSSMANEGKYHQPLPVTTAPESFVFWEMVGRTIRPYRSCFFGDISGPSKIVVEVSGEWISRWAVTEILVIFDVRIILPGITIHSTDPYNQPV